jgi:hypothetical protein
MLCGTQLATGLILNGLDVSEFEVIPVCTLRNFHDNRHRAICNVTPGKTRDVLSRGITFTAVSLDDFASYIFRPTPA